MAEQSPIFQVTTGETITDASGQKPAYRYFRLRWDQEERPGPDGKTVFFKTMVHTTKYPGSTDELDRVLRSYGPDGKMVERDEALDSGETRRIGDLFEKNAETIENGTPLGVLNLDPAKIASLNSKNVYTVEGLRDVPDVVLPDLGQGGRALRQRAIDFLESKDRNAEMSKLTSENESLKEEVRVMQETMAEMREEMKSLRTSVDGSARKKGA